MDINNTQPVTHAAERFLKGVGNRKKTNSYITHLRQDGKPGGSKRTTAGEMFKTIRDHYMRPPGTDRNGKCIQPGLYNLAAGDANNESTKNQRAQCRKRLMDALTQDKRVLSNTQRNALTMEQILDPENIQQAIDDLNNNTVPGEDGWTAEFFKVVGMREMPHGEQDGEGEGDAEVMPGTGRSTRPPSALAHLLSLAFLDCVRGNGRIENIHTAVVSLIYKDKGKRYDAGMYRPIAVQSIVYRILGKAMVIALNPMLMYLTSTAQKAFKKLQYL